MGHVPPLLPTWAIRLSLAAADGDKPAGKPAAEPEKPDPDRFKAKKRKIRIRK
jgi:hypothetical protein